jgi:hypothetical protein
MNAVVRMGTEIDLTITGITCRGGPGTMYRVSASTAHHRVYSFFQLIQENRANPASDDIEFWVKPGDVKAIRAPAFNDLPVHLRTILSDADMREEESEDQDLLGKSSQALYDALGAFEKGMPVEYSQENRAPNRGQLFTVHQGFAGMPAGSIFCLRRHGTVGSAPRQFFL